MNALLGLSTAKAQSVPKIKRNDNLFTDGKWRSFPKIPNLLQYVVAETYYARCKVNGKPVRASLETDVFTTAKVRLSRAGCFNEGDDAVELFRRWQTDWLFENVHASDFVGRIAVTQNARQFENTPKGVHGVVEY